jgi:hypothetical protein
MKLLRVSSLVFGLFLSTTAQAQVFWQSPDYSGTPLIALETGFDTPMPGATPFEIRSALLWNLRSALNLSALQCQFEPTLRTTENYNAILNDHKDELTKAYAAISAYFKRTKKPASASQKALDVFGTRTISNYSTVRGVLGFCQTSGMVGRSALFTPKGQLSELATQRLKELRNSLKPVGEQRFRRLYLAPGTARIPVADPRCWNKKGGYINACGWAN